VSLPDPLPPLTAAEIEALVAALDPLLDGFGEGESCLDDAAAYLSRLGLTDSTGSTGGSAAPGRPEPSAPDDPGTSALTIWLERWRQEGGNRQTLRLLLSTLQAWQT